MGQRDKRVPDAEVSPRIGSGYTESLWEGSTTQVSQQHTQRQWKGTT